jgi:hypothetical protein
MDPCGRPGATFALLGERQSGADQDEHAETPEETDR